MQGFAPVTTIIFIHGRVRTEKETAPPEISILRFHLLRFHGKISEKAVFRRYI